MGTRLQIVLMALVQSTLWLATQGRPSYDWQEAAVADATAQIVGIRNSPESGIANVDLLQLSSALRHLTGIDDLSFDLDGKLRFRGAAFSNSGSRTARELLLRAAQEVSVTIEDHGGSHEVDFADITAVSNYGFVSGFRKQGKLDIFEFDKIVVGYNLRLDPHDLSLIRGHPAAIESFGIGLIFLHELSHAVLKKKDDKEAAANSAVGEAAAFMNRVRMEMGLPLRIRYRPEVLRLGSSLFERMRFEGVDCTCFAVWPAHEKRRKN